MRIRKRATVEELQNAIEYLDNMIAEWVDVFNPLGMSAADKFHRIVRRIQIIKMNLEDELEERLENENKCG